MKTAPILEKDGAVLPLSGTANQIELASRIRASVQVEFDGIASLLRLSAEPHSEQFGGRLSRLMMADPRYRFSGARKADYVIHAL